MIAGSAVTSGKLAVGAVGPRELGDNLPVQAANSSGNNEQYTGSCSLSMAADVFCYPTTAAATFTPSVNVRCIVSLQAQIILPGTASNPSDDGPYLRIAINKNGATNVNDGTHGFYFLNPNNVTSKDSNELTRTVVIAVPAGQATKFGGAFLATPADWDALVVAEVVSWICF